MVSLMLTKCIYWSTFDELIYEGKGLVPVFSTNVADKGASRVAGSQSSDLTTWTPQKTSMVQLFSYRMLPHHQFNNGTNNQTNLHILKNPFIFLLSACWNKLPKSRKSIRINRPETRYIGVFVTFDNHHYTIRCRTTRSFSWNKRNTLNIKWRIIH